MNEILISDFKEQIPVFEITETDMKKTKRRSKETKFMETELEPSQKNYQALLDEVSQDRQRIHACRPFSRMLFVWGRNEVGVRIRKLRNDQRLRRRGVGRRRSAECRRNAQRQACHNPLQRHPVKIGARG